MSTIRDIAAKANVSIGAVSRVLNYDETISVSESTKKKIFEIAEELDYIPLRERKSSKQNYTTLAVIQKYSEEQQLQDPFYLSIRFGLEKRCMEENIKLARINTMGNIEAPVSLDGIAAIGAYEDSEIEEISRLSSNIVFIDSSPDISRFDSVEVDFEGALTNALDYLNSLGHSKIGYIGGHSPVESKNYKGEYYREEAFTKYMKAIGKFNSEFMIQGDFSHIGGYSTHDDGYRFMKQALQSKNIPTAFFIASDSMAIGAYKAILEYGLRIPEDISIIGFDDIPTAKYMVPALSTIKVYTKFMGECAVDLLLERIKGDRGISKKVIIPTKLLIRESCAKI